MGATVSWDDNTKTATAIKGNTIVVLPLNSQFAEINDVPCALDAAPEIVAGFFKSFVQKRVNEGKNRIH
jgi:hypothetical protein